MWQARKNKKEKCRLYFANVYGSKKGEAMRTKIEYEKLEYDFWNLEEIREHFENGELYRRSRDQFFKFEEMADLGVAADIKDTIYRRTETKIILEEEILEIKQADHKYDLEFFFEDEKVKVFDSIYHMIDIDPETIHALSDLLKQYGK